MIARAALTIGLLACWIAALIGVTTAFARALWEAWR